MCKQVDDEIAIWICGEPRFVSGITDNTSCNDLIDALIEDELNGNKAGRWQLFSISFYRRHLFASTRRNSLNGMNEQYWIWMTFLLYKL